MRHTGTVELETERLILRKFTREDAPKMFQNWASDPDVPRYMTWKAHKSVAETEAYLDSIVAKYPENWYEWCVVWKETGEPVGSVGCINPSEEVQSIEIGWCLSRLYWGRGIMPEAANRVLRHLFEEVGANRVSSCHFLENPKSGRVMQKIGMTCEGTLRQNAKDNEGNLVDVKVYSILREEWRERNAQEGLK